MLRCEKNILANDNSQVDDTGTKAAQDRLAPPVPNGDASPAAEDSTAGPINENLFLDEDLDEELQNLDLED